MQREPGGVSCTSGIFWVSNAHCASSLLLHDVGWKLLYANDSSLPRYTCLVPIAKCENLSYLDLSLVIDRLSYLDIQQAVSELWNLETLYLGRSTVIDGDAYGFPKFLTEFQLSGRIAFDLNDRRKMVFWYFMYPRELYDLTFYEVTPLNRQTMRRLLGFPPLEYNLGELRIVPGPDTEREALHEIPKRLRLLSTLHVSGDLMRPSFFDTLQSLAAERRAGRAPSQPTSGNDSDTDMSDMSESDKGPPLYLLNTLILDKPPSDNRALGFELDDLAARLEKPDFLPALRIVWLHPIYKDLPGREELHKALQSRFRAQVMENLQKNPPRPGRPKPNLDEIVPERSGVRIIVAE